MIRYLRFPIYLSDNINNNIATPFSVKAIGSFLVPPQLDPPKWRFKSVNSLYSLKSRKITIQNLKYTKFYV